MYFFFYTVNFYPFTFVFVDQMFTRLVNASYSPFSGQDPTLYWTKVRFFWDTRFEKFWSFLNPRSPLSICELPLSGHIWALEEVADFQSVAMQQTTFHVFGSINPRVTSRRFIVGD